MVVRTSLSLFFCSGTKLARFWHTIGTILVLTRKSIYGIMIIMKNFIEKNIDRKQYRIFSCFCEIKSDIVFLEKAMRMKYFHV